MDTKLETDASKFKEVSMNSSESIFISKEGEMTFAPKDNEPKSLQIKRSKDNYTVLLPSDDNWMFVRDTYHKNSPVKP